LTVFSLNTCIIVKIVMYIHILWDMLNLDTWPQITMTKHCDTVCDQKINKYILVNTDAVKLVLEMKWNWDYRYEN
jgi:hypothetical protein